MDINGIISAIGVGIVLGVLGRLVVRGYQPVGCIMTILLGILGGFVGWWLGKDVFALSNDFLVFLVQVAASALLIALFLAIVGRRSYD